VEPIEPEHVNSNDNNEETSFENKSSILPKPVLIQDKITG